VKTLITGATGFLGSHLVHGLVAREGASGFRVFSQSRSEALAKLGVEVLTGSVTDPAAVARAVDGVSHIYHLAGFVSRKPEEGPRMYQVHVEGTRLLCSAARAAGARRIVLASTSGTIAVSERADEKPDESCPPPLSLISRWPYYASKYYQEEAARRACEGGPELVIVNPSLLLGPGDDRLSSTRDIVTFLARDIPMTPPGGLNVVDVRDVAAVLPAAMERGRHGERYLLGGHNWSFADYFGRLERLTKVPAPLLRAPKGRISYYATQVQAALYRKVGRTPPVEPEAVEMATYYWYFDSTRAGQELGFLARDAAETLHDTVTYIRTHILGRPAAAAA
jgi:dihydroflavonol-4-reductase